MTITGRHSLIPAMCARLLFAGAFVLFTQAGPAQTNRAPAAKTEKDYRDFAVALEKSMSEGQPEHFARAMDVDALLDRALTGIRGSEKIQNDFRAGLKSGFGREITSNFGQISDYKLLHLVSTNGYWLAMFRMLNEDSGLNYHNLLLEQRGNRIRIGDFHNAVTGEFLSQTLRRVALPILANAEKSLIDRLVGTENDLVKYGKDWMAVVNLSKQGESEKVLAAYKKLPASLQREKFILVHRIKAAQDISEDEYQKAISFWTMAHPNDPSVPLIAIDGYMLKKQYSNVVKSIDRLDALVGGDPYLHLLRAGQFKLMNQPAKARESVDRAIREEPTMSAAYDFAIESAMDDKDHKRMVQMLDAAEKNLEIDLSTTVEETEAYKEFRNSNEYRDWKKSRAQSPSGQR